MDSEHGSRSASTRRELAEHLRYYSELGVESISRKRVKKEGSSATSAKDRLRVLSEDATTCKRCKLHESRNLVVFGEGDPSARLMFIGEAPGRDEDLQGRPFVGRAGQLLTKMIEAMGYQRSDVFIANVLKCRPPGNRNPEIDEIASCEPYLLQQIDLISPEVICSLGAFAAKTLLRTDRPISSLRGRFVQCAGRRLMPTFHPAYLLRNPSKKREAWDDLQQIMAVLKGDTAAPADL